MTGGLTALVFGVGGTLALLVLALEVIVRLFPRRLLDEMQDMVAGDQPGPRPEPEMLDRMREAGL